MAERSVAQKLLIKPGNAVWVSLWRLMADYGVRPITQVAVDEVWSALRFRQLTDAERGTAQG